MQELLRRVATRSSEQISLAGDRAPGGGVVACSGTDGHGAVPVIATAKSSLEYCYEGRRRGTVGRPSSRPREGGGG